MKILNGHICLQLRTTEERLVDIIYTLVWQIFSNTINTYEMFQLLVKKSTVLGIWEIIFKRVDATNLIYHYEKKMFSLVKKHLSITVFIRMSWLIMLGIVHEVQALITVTHALKCHFELNHELLPLVTRSTWGACEYIEVVQP